jgi:urease accessory protein
MSAASLTSAPAARLQRASGVVRASFRRSGGATRLEGLYQAGTGKLRMPRVAPGEALEGILLNTGGGMTGGDRFRVEIALAAGAAAVVTTQACEKVYRALDDTAMVENRLVLGPGARLDWLPQETILFDEAAFTRSLDVDLSADSELVAVEAVVLGRTARGETVRRGTLRERFRVRRGGRLLFADGARLDGAVAEQAARAAMLGGAAAFATALVVRPDVESIVDDLRAVLCDSAGECGVSAWNGMLAARFVCGDGRALRRDLVTFLSHVRQRAVPRVWTC